jgi:hypothetical protein
LATEPEFRKALSLLPGAAKGSQWISVLDSDEGTPRGGNREAGAEIIGTMGL